MVEKNDGYIVSEEVGTVWGYNDIPRNRRKKEEHQNHFRWFQVSNFWLSNKYVINSSLLITGIQTKYELLNLLWTISDHLLHCLKDSGLGDIYDCWILILFNISMYPDDYSCYISYHLCVCKSAFNESVLIQGVRKWRLHRIWL